MDALFTPQMSIELYIKQRNISIDQIGVAPIVPISWGHNMVRSLAESINALPSDHWPYGERQPFFSGSVGRNQVCMVEMPVGAPGTIMIMEAMITAGAHIFLD